MQALLTLTVDGLQDDGDDDEQYAAPEGSAHFPTLVEDYHGEDDAVDWLHVVGEVHREGGYGAHGLQLEEEGNDGEDGGKDGHVKEVVAGDVYRGCGIEVQVEGHEGCKQDDAGVELAEEEVAALDACLMLHLLAEHGEDGVDYGAAESVAYSQTVARVETEDEQYADDGEEAQCHFLCPRPTALGDGFDDGGAEAVEGDADDGNADVGGFDTGVEEDPVGGQRGSAEEELPEVALPGHVGLAAETREA